MPGVLKGSPLDAMVHLAQWLSLAVLVHPNPSETNLRGKGIEMGRFGCAEISRLIDLHMYLVAGRR